MSQNKLNSLQTIKVVLTPPNLGEPYVHFINYLEGESPVQIPPAIILIRPNENTDAMYNSGQLWENLGVMTLAAYLETKGIKFGVLEAALFNCKKSQILNLVQKYNPCFVGISVFSTSSLRGCLGLAGGIKRKNKNISIVLGGHGVSFVANEVLRDYQSVDFVIRSEGENSLFMLLQASQSKDWENIPNLVYRTAEGIKANPVTTIEHNLDNIPLPHRFARDIMMTDPVLAQAPLMAIGSRGCYDRCKYCSVSAFYGSAWRSRSPQHVVDELEFLIRRYDKHILHFWDDQFIGPGKKGRERVMAFADEIIKRNLQLTFHITLRPTGLDDLLLDRLVQAGLRSVYIGLENQSQDALDFFGKHIKASDGLATIKQLWHHNVCRIIFGYILFHPKMSWNELRANLDFMDDLPTMDLHRIFSRMGYYPGTVFWKEQNKTSSKTEYLDLIETPLPNEGLERLNDVCFSFYEDHTLNIEALIVALEDQHMADLEIIQFLATCRTQLWRFMTNRVRKVAILIESGQDYQVQVKNYGAEIEAETLKVVGLMRRKIQRPYFTLLLKIFGFDANQKS